LARLFSRDGYNVLAIDADPNINLAYSIGIPHSISDKIIPLSENEVLIEERTGMSTIESYGAVFNMTPRVDDIVDHFGVVGPDNVKLLTMGTVQSGGTGCMCGANALLRVLMQHVLIQRKEVVIMDMVAGLEHLGRGTARRMDSIIVVLEPRMKSVDTFKRIVKLAKDIEVDDVLAVGNKIRNIKEKEFINEKVGALGFEVVAHIPFDPLIGEADMMGKASIDYNPRAPALVKVEKLKDYLKTRYGL
jgi:CO dehydrogenase maturation factor